MLCVYALTPSAARRVRSRGIDGEPLRAVTRGAVSAIVGDLRAPPKPVSDRLARYDAVIQHLARSHASLLPVRFGTCFAHVGELTFVLDTRQDSFHRALRRVRNRAQMTVRILTVEEGGGQQPRGTGQAPGDRQARATAVLTTRTGAGSAYLRERASEAARDREVEGFDPVRTAVRRWVRDERVEKREGVATVYHLVPRSAAAAYTRSVRAAAERAGLRLVVSGPFPPYAFGEW